jgi:hypothetical protein
VAIEAANEIEEVK